MSKTRTLQSSCWIFSLLYQPTTFTLMGFLIKEHKILKQINKGNKVEKLDTNPESMGVSVRLKPPQPNVNLQSCKLIKQCQLGSKCNFCEVSFDKTDEELHISWS